MENPNTPKTSEEIEAHKQQLLDRANKKYAEFLEKRIVRDEKEQVKPSGFLDKAKSYAEAVVSRGLNNKECSPETKQLRLLSCHGDGTDSLPPCADRKNSKKYEGSFFCGACGCGDKKSTQLINISINGESQYSKLDHPKFSCPLKMPGFTDYQCSRSGVSDNFRKKEIENRHSIEYITEHSKP